MPTCLLLLSTSFIGCARPDNLEAKALLDRLLTAHGGPEALEQLHNIHIKGELDFKKRVLLSTEIHYENATRWSVHLKEESGQMDSGLFDGRCWAAGKGIAQVCDPDEEEDLSITGERMQARLLFALHDAKPILGPQVELASGKAQSVQIGRMTLVPHPQSHRLAQIRYQVMGREYVEDFSDHREVAGALVAFRRVLHIGGDFDLDERWTEILLGQPAISEPALAAPGEWSLISDQDQLIAWTELDSLDNLPVNVRRFINHMEKSGNLLSTASGFVLSPAQARQAASPNSPGSWQLAVFLEAGPVQLSKDGDFNVATWHLNDGRALHYQGQVPESLPKAFELFHQEMGEPEFKEENASPHLRIWFSALPDDREVLNYTLIADPLPWKAKTKESGSQEQE